MMRMTTLCAAMAAAGLVAALPAAAQTGAAEAAKPGEVQEVVVTAQKRVQASSKVPLALTAIDGETLRSSGIASAANLADLTPNVQIGLGAQGGMEISIRGIGNSDNTERGDPQAAFHVDGIYIGRPQGAGALFYDLDRIEVLRGPQGTLYGRNANAGAVNVITRKPGRKFEGAVSAEVGNYSTANVEGMVNVPLNANLALRAVVASYRHKGYSDTANPANGFSKDSDDRDNLSARVQALWKPTASISWLVGTDGSRDRDAGVAAFDLTSDRIPEQRAMTPQVQMRRDNNTWGVTSEFKVGLGSMELVHLYGHRVSERDELLSYGPAPTISAPFSSTFTQDSHELRLGSADNGPLQWVAGLYWFKETGRNIDLDAILASGVRFQRFIQDPAVNTSLALFGQATYSLTPTFRATLGLRHNRDEKSRKGKTLNTNNVLIGNIGNDAAGEWSKSTYRVGVEYDLSPKHMVYANVSTGYKAGGFNDGNGTVGDANYNPNLYYNPETITAYELGLKGRFLDNKLQLGSSLFYYDYTDLQRSTIPPGSGLVTLNAAKARVTGVEFEGKLAVGDNGRLNFALGLLDAEYSKFTSPSGADLTGQPLDRAPKSTLSLGYTHNWDLASGARVTGYLGSRYSSNYVFTDVGTAARAPRMIHQPAFTKTDLTLTYAPADDAWQVQIYGKNLENKNTLAAPQFVQGRILAMLAEPRAFGVRASFKF